MSSDIFRKKWFLKKGRKFHTKIDIWASIFNNNILYQRSWELKNECSRKNRRIFPFPLICVGYFIIKKSRNTNITLWNTKKIHRVLRGWNLESYRSKHCQLLYMKYVKEARFDIFFQLKRVYSCKWRELRHTYALDWWIRLAVIADKHDSFQFCLSDAK